MNNSLRPWLLLWGLPIVGAAGLIALWILYRWRR